MRPITIALAFLSLAGVTIAQDKTLTPEVQQLQWNGWLVTIDELEFTSSVEHYGLKRAGPDSIFVRMALSVKNEKNRGQGFAPRDVLKIVIGPNQYDAENLNPMAEFYTDNIEPTLIKTRLCYFELPLAQIGDSFVLQFAGLTAEKKTVKVTIAEAAPPAPMPTPEPYLETSGQQQGDGYEIKRLASTPAPTPFKLTLAMVDARLAQAWKSLTPEQRSQLKREEEKWIKQTAGLPEEERIQSTSKRAEYLWSLVERTFDD